MSGVQRVEDYMQSDVITIAPSDNAAEAERRFVEHGIGGAPVVSHGRPVGVLSRTDLLRRLVIDQTLSDMVSDYYRDPGLPVRSELAEVDIKHLQRARVEEMMSPHVISIDADASVVAAAQLLRDKNIHRVLVLRNGQLVGLLTAHDLLRVIAE